MSSRRICLIQKKPNTFKGIGLGVWLGLVSLNELRDRLPRQSGANEFNKGSDGAEVLNRFNSMAIVSRRHWNPAERLGACGARSGLGKVRFW